MFKCEKCGKITKAGEKQYRKVVEIRQKTYYNIDKCGKEKETIGQEIVKELKICEKCAEEEEKEDGR